MSFLQTMMNAMQHSQRALIGIAELEKESDIDIATQALNDSCQKITIAENILKDNNVELLNQLQQLKQQLAVIVEKVNNLK